MIYGPYRTHASTPQRFREGEAIVPEVNAIETKRASKRRYTPPPFADPFYEFREVAKALALLRTST